MDIYPMHWKRILISMSLPKKNTANIDVNQILSLLNSIDQLNNGIYTLDTKIYWILNGITSHPKCLTCKKELINKNVKNIRKGYQHLHCSVSCGNSDPNVLKRAEETSYKLYGTRLPSQSNIVKDKIRKRNQELYGVDWYTQSDKFKQQYKYACIKQYGVDNIAKSEIGQKHIQETCMNRYGVKNAMQCSSILNKTKQKYVYDNIHFDSKYEIALYIYLTDYNIDFEYAPNISFEYTFNEKRHVYIPDFVVNGIVVEIKGNHFFKDDGTMQNPFDHSQDGLYEAKHQCMLKNNVVILKSSDCKKYIEYVQQKYGKGYLEQFKNKKQ